MGSTPSLGTMTTDRKHEGGCGVGSGIEPCICGVDDARRDALEEAVAMLDDMARDWHETEARAQTEGERHHAQIVARTYEKAARKVAGLG